jgi:hypothetical protein
MAIALLGTAALPATAAMIRVPIEDSVRASDIVVRARTMDQRCEWSGDGRWIYTFVRAQILETMGGHPDGEDIVVRVLGGAMDGIGLRVSDMPLFEIGEESVLFLKRSSDGSFYTVVDNFQGKNTLWEGKVVERELSESDFVNQVRACAREHLD